MAGNGTRREVRLALRFARATLKKLRLVEDLLICTNAGTEETASATKTRKLSYVLERRILQLGAELREAARKERAAEQEAQGADA